MAKVVKQDSWAIEFTDEEISYFGLKEGDSFSVDTDGESLVLKPFKFVEIDLGDFEREDLERLIKLSCDLDLSVNQVIATAVGKVL
jgi:hypothetical protein